jgi:hypothetical protein
MSSSGTESDSSASGDVDFDDYGEFGYQLEPEYTEEELRQMEEAASAQRREIENNSRQNDTNWCSCSKCISLPLPSECLCVFLAKWLTFSDPTNKLTISHESTLSVS